MCDVLFLSTGLIERWALKLGLEVQVVPMSQSPREPLQGS